MSIQDSFPACPRAYAGGVFKKTVLLLLDCQLREFRASWIALVNELLFAMKNKGVSGFGIISIVDFECLQGYDQRGKQRGMWINIKLGV